VSNLFGLGISDSSRRANIEAQSNNGVAAASTASILVQSEGNDVMTSGMTGAI
jgi:hypothetical protein